MEVIKTFVSQFTDNFNFDNITKINKKYFLVEENLLKLNEKLDEDEIRFSGLYLGEEKSKKFITSITLLEILKDKSNKYIKLNEKASWLFSCGRDIFSDSIEEESNSFGTVLVLNTHNEVIGLAKKDKKNKNLYLNFYDIGHFLRREKK